jgi:putative hemolysin
MVLRIAVGLYPWSPPIDGNLLTDVWRRITASLHRLKARLRPQPSALAQVLGAAPPLHHVPWLQKAVMTAVQHGTVHPQSADIACRALDFGALRLAEVMVPRNRVKAIAKDTPPESLRRILLEEAYSRMPVYDGTLDVIVGILVAKDALVMAWESPLVVLDDLLQPPFFAPETMHAADLLKELQNRRLHFAVVVDELGGTAGIVTLEDLLEELVGDIYGQHDAHSPQLVHRDADGTVTVEGMMPVRDANRELHLALPEGDTFCTVGGLCVSHAGRIPEAGYQLAYRDGMVLEVVEASPRSVVRVRLRRQPKAGHKARPSG